MRMRMKNGSTDYRYGDWGDMGGSLSGIGFALSVGKT